MIRVGWALVNYGPIYSPVYSSHLRAIAYASRALQVDHLGSIGAVGASDRSYTHTAENKCTDQMLLVEDLTHFFYCESDMILPDDTIPRLLEVDKPIVSGLYFLRQGDGQPCLYKRVIGNTANEQSMSPVTLFPTDRPFSLKNGCPGLGCVLIKREVFEQLRFPWFDLKEGQYGSDLYFYTKVRKANIDVWVHPGVACGQIEYTEWSIDDYYHRMQIDPGFANRGVIVGSSD